MNQPRIGLILQCEGMGDCLFAIPVIRRLVETDQRKHVFDIFTHHPALFAACPYVERVYAIQDGEKLSYYRQKNKVKAMFDARSFPHMLMDTMDFLSVPLNLGQLSFRQKQLEYFPTEVDQAERFDVVINTSMTWASRTWAMENWVRLAGALRARGCSVAVVGKDVKSEADRMTKTSQPIEGCENLINRLSLDQTYFTIAKCGVFVTCQNGLSVLAGATDTEIVVLDMSIEWSKRAIYRHENPFYKVTYVKGGCRVYCCSAHSCPLPENNGEFKCVPTYEDVHAAVFARLENRGGAAAADAGGTAGGLAPAPG